MLSLRAATLSCTLIKSLPFLVRTWSLWTSSWLAGSAVGPNRSRSAGARRLTAETYPSVSIEVVRVAAEDRRHHNGSRRQAARTAEISPWLGCQRADGPESLATGRGRRDRSLHGLTLAKKGGRRLCANAMRVTYKINEDHRDHRRWRPARWASGSRIGSVPLSQDHAS